MTLPAATNSTLAGNAALDIENSTVAETTFGGQLPVGTATTNGVVINGQGTLTLLGINQIGNLTFNTNGASPVVNVNGDGVLVINGDITAHTGNVVATGATITHINGNTTSWTWPAGRPRSTWTARRRSGWPSSRTSTTAGS